MFQGYDLLLLGLNEYSAHENNCPENRLQFTSSSCLAHSWITCMIQLHVYEGRSLDRGCQYVVLSLEKRCVFSSKSVVCFAVCHLVFILQADVIQVSRPSTHMYILTMCISPHIWIPIQDGVTADQVAEVEGNLEVCEELRNICMVVIGHSVR